MPLTPLLLDQLGTSVPDKEKNMKYAKMLGLMAVAAAALMAFAASASATSLTSPTGTTYTGTITAVNEGNVSLDGSFVTVTCAASHVEGKVEQHGAGVTVKGNISTLTFGSCNFPVTVNAAGSLEVHAVTEKVNTPPAHNTIETCSTLNKIECTGTLTSSGAKVTIATSVGNCVFTTNATDIGTLTPTNHTGGHATLDIGAPNDTTGRIPRTEGNFLCGSSGQWTGKYTVTTPSTLYVDHS
jgi:hypothetical protein